MKSDDELATEAANELFDNDDFESIRNKIFTRSELQRLAKPIILAAILMSKAIEKAHRKPWQQSGS